MCQVVRVSEGALWIARGLQGRGVRGQLHSHCLNNAAHSETLQQLGALKGQRGDTLIIPLLPGEYTFEIRALEQPEIFRNWQAW